ncbi:MAG: hypothetical protein Q4B14_01255 [Clostridia bacterium]|nr:hypothetical protein [Clostridia bacterium]
MSEQVEKKDEGVTFSSNPYNVAVNVVIDGKSITNTKELEKKAEKKDKEEELSVDIANNLKDEGKKKKLISYITADLAKKEKAKDDAKEKKAEDMLKAYEEQEKQKNKEEGKKKYGGLTTLYLGLIDKTKGTALIEAKEANAKKLAELSNKEYKSSINPLEEKANEHETLVQAYNSQKGNIKSALDSLAKKGIKWNNIFGDQSLVGKKDLAFADQKSFLQRYAGFKPKQKEVSSDAIMDNLIQVKMLADHMGMFRMSGTMLDAMDKVSNGFDKDKKPVNNMEKALSDVGITATLNIDGEVSNTDLKTYLEAMEKASAAAKDLEEPQAASMIILCAAYKLAKYREKLTSKQYTNELSTYSSADFYKTGVSSMDAIYSGIAKTEKSRKKAFEKRKTKEDEDKEALTGKSQELKEAEKQLAKKQEEKSTFYELMQTQTDMKELAGIVKKYKKDKGIKPESSIPEPTDKKADTDHAIAWRAQRKIYTYGQYFKSYLNDKTVDKKKKKDNISFQEYVNTMGTNLIEEVYAKETAVANLKNEIAGIDARRNQYFDEMHDQGNKITQAEKLLTKYANFSNKMVTEGVGMKLQDLDEASSNYILDDNFLYYFDLLPKMKKILSEGTPTAYLIESKKSDILQDISSTEFDKKLEQDSTVKAYLKKFSVNNISLTDMSEVLGIENKDDPKSKKEKEKKVKSRRKREQDIKKESASFKNYFTTDNLAYNVFSETEKTAKTVADNAIDLDTNEKTKETDTEIEKKIELDKYKAAKALASARQAEMASAQAELEKRLLDAMGDAKVNKNIQQELLKLFKKGKSDSKDIFKNGEPVVAKWSEIKKATDKEGNLIYDEYGNYKVKEVQDSKKFEASDYEKLCENEAFKGVFDQYMTVTNNILAEKKKNEEADKAYNDILINEYNCDMQDMDFKTNKAFEKALVEKRAKANKDTLKNTQDTLPILIDATKHTTNTVEHIRRGSLIKESKKNLQKLSAQTSHFDKQFFNLALIYKDQLATNFSNDSNFDDIKNISLADASNETVRSKAIKALEKLVEKQGCPADLVKSYRNLKAISDQNKNSAALAAKKDSQTMKLLDAQISRASCSTVKSIVDIVGDMSTIAGNTSNMITSILSADFYKSKSGSYSADIDASLKLSLQNNKHYKNSQLATTVISSFIMPLAKLGSAIASAFDKKSAMAVEKKTLSTLLDRQIALDSLPKTAPNTDELMNAVKTGRDLNKSLGKEGQSLYLPAFGGSDIDQAGKSAYVLQALRHYATFSEMGGSVPSVIQACEGKESDKDDAKKIALLRALACYRA